MSLESDFLQAIQQQTDNIIILLTPEFNIISMNSAAIHLFEWHAQEINQQPITALLNHYPPLKELFPKNFKHTLTQQPSIEIEKSLVQHDNNQGRIIALSTYLPLAHSLEKEASTINKNIPVFIGHGESDPLIPIDFARYSRNVLENNGYQIEWHKYRTLEHGVCLEEIQDLNQWLDDILALIE